MVLLPVFSGWEKVLQSQVHTFSQLQTKVRTKSARSKIKKINKYIFCILLNILNFIMNPFRT